MAGDLVHRRLRPPAWSGPSHCQEVWVSPCWLVSGTLSLVRYWNKSSVTLGLSLESGPPVFAGLSLRLPSEERHAQRL